LGGLLAVGKADPMALMRARKRRVKNCMDGSVDYGLGFGLGLGLGLGLEGLEID
jgi:hypothetical protein